MIEIRIGVEEKYRHQAARIYVNAFKSKFENLIGDETSIQSLFEEAMNPEYALCAYNDKDELVGIAGFNVGNKKLVDMKIMDFINQFGYLKGLWKAFLVEIIFTRKPNSNHELLMDGIAVKEECRGQGIGSELFDALMKYAEVNNYRKVRLDVIDKNLRAKRLYEKIGFQKKGYQKVPKFLNKKIGVSGVTSMVKEL